MNLFLHLLIHFFFSLLAGFLVFRIWKKPLASFASAIFGGVLVDSDHLIDYLLAFGYHFRLDYFTQGYQFLKSDKIYILFHAWEYVAVLLLIALLVKNKTARSIALGLGIGLFFHLSTDVVIDAVPIRTYSIIYRAENNFEIQKMAYPEHWERHLRKKAATTLEY